MKLWRVSIVVLALLTVISAYAYAHPGRTDGSGGHTNHSTGEYHYHHGYDDHQHYDMDGDGIEDCPYKFKDNTTHKGSSFSNASAKVNTSAEKQKKSSSLSTKDKVLSVVFVLSLACVIFHEIKK